MKVRSIFILLTLFTVFQYAQADVRVKLTQPPPNQLRAADLWKLTLDNADTITYRIRLEGTLDEADAGRVADGTSGVITLPRGRKTITYDDVKRGGSVNFKAGKWRDAFTRTGNAPSGDYTICITVKSEAGDELGKDCIQQHVEITLPPTLISPADGETITERQPLIFTWMPPTPASSNVTYDLKIVEVQGNQSPEEAMRKNAVLFEKKDIRTTTFQYPTSARRLETGKNIIWSVKAKGVWSDMFTLNITKGEVRTDLVPTNCASLKAEFIPTIKGDSRCFQLLMYNNSSDSSENTRMGKNSTDAGRKKMFHIRLENDSIYSIEGGVSTGWTRDRDKIPPPIRDITWTSASGTIPRGKTNFGSICVGSVAETLYIAYEWLNSEHEVICAKKSAVYLPIKSGISEKSPCTDNTIPGTTITATGLGPDGRPLWETGKLYLKIKDRSNVDLLRFPNIPLDKTNRIRSVMLQYGVTLVEKPFVEFKTPKFDRTYRIIFSDTLNVNCFINDLTSIDFVEYAEKVPAMYEQTAPDDPRYLIGDQYYLDAAHLNIGATSNIYSTPIGGPGNTVVAIVDDAVETTHDDLTANIVTYGYDVADNDGDPNPPFSGSCQANGSRFSHGTHVAGIAGGVTNNTVGIASIGWSNNIMGVKIKNSNNCGPGLPYAFDGVTYAANNHAGVINMSWGGWAPSQTHYSVLDFAKNTRQAVLVAAAGNGSSMAPFYPAAYGEWMTGQSWETFDRKLVIAVSALDQNNDRSVWPPGISGQPSGSNIGPWVDISAYGTHIVSTIANSSNGAAVTNQYAFYDGTSMAAPMVSGVAGLMRSFKSIATPNEIYDCLVYTANQDIYGSSHPNHIPGTLGFGRLYPEAALRCINGACGTPAAPPVAIIIPSSQSICPNTSVTLTANHGIAYHWSNGSTTQSISVNVPGTYAVDVTFPGSPPCIAHASITISPANTQASITLVENSGLYPNDGILCGLDMITQLYCSYGLSYQWSTFGATTQQIPGTINAGSIIQPALWNFSVTIHCPGGCAGIPDAIATGQATWFPLPTATAASSCTGGTLNLTSSGGNSYSWEGPNGFTSTQQNPSINNVTMANAGIYTVTVTDANGCANTASVSATVNCPPLCLTVVHDSVWCTPQGYAFRLTIQNLSSTCQSFKISPPPGTSTIMCGPPSLAGSQITTVTGGIFGASAGQYCIRLSCVRSGNDTCYTEYCLELPQCDSCNCGTWDHTKIEFGPLTTTKFVLNAETVTGVHAPNAVTVTPKLNCTPVASQCEPTYQWTYTGPTSGSGISIPFEISPTQPGWYGVTVKGICGPDTCDGIKFYVRVDSCVPRPGGMIGWWPGDGNANDITVNANHGTMVGGITFTTAVDGKVGQAFQFDGVDGKVDLPDNGTLDFNNHDFTVDAWFNLHDYYTGNPYPGQACQYTPIVSNDAWGWNLAISNVTQKIRFSAWSALNSHSGVGSTSTVSLNTWYHVAAVFSAATSTVSIYVNGLLENSATIPTTTIYYTNGDSPHIGAWSSCGWSPNFFNGLIDEVEIFDTALTMEEIQSIFNAGIYGKCK